MRPQTIYLIAVAGRSLGFSTAFTLFAVYLVRDLGTNPVELVLPATIYELTTFLFEIPTGIVADVYSRRLSVIVGYLLLGLGFILTGVLPLYIMAIIGLGVAGFGSTFVSGALSAWLVDEIGQERASIAFLQRAQVSLVVSLVGIILSVVIGSIDLRLPVLLGGVVIVICAFILILFMPETGFQRIPASERDSWKDLFKTFQQGIVFVQKQKILLWILLITFVFAGFQEAFGIMRDAHLLISVTLPDLGELGDVVWFGIIRAMFIPLGLISTELVKKRVNLEEMDTVVRLLSIIFIGMIACVVFFALVEHFVLMLFALMLSKMTITMASPLIEVWSNRHIESGVRATVLSIQGQIHALGEVVGGPVIGGIGTLSSIRFAITISALSLLPLIPVFNHSRRLQGISNTYQDSSSR